MDKPTDRVSTKMHLHKRVLPNINAQETRDRLDKSKEISHKGLKGLADILCRLLKSKH